MALKDKKAKKQKRRPRAGKKPSYLGKVVVLGARQTGLNRDIPPMGGAGGSQNLLAALAARPPVSGQGYTIQTPDQFAIQQDIKSIKQEQTGIAQEIGVQAAERKRRADSNLTKEENAARREEALLKKEMAKAAAIMKETEAAQKRANIKASGQEILAGKAKLIAKAAGASPLPQTNAEIPTKIRAKPGPKPKGKQAMTGGMQTGGEAASEFMPALSAGGMPTSIVGDADATGAPNPRV
jgi:hypothetical protein